MATFTYDARGRRLSSANYETSVSVTYDDDGLVTSRTSTVPSVSQTFERDVDPRGLCTEVDGPAGAMGYRHDRLGRRSGWDWEDGSAFGAEYFDAAGRPIAQWSPPTMAELENLQTDPTDVSQLPATGRRIGWGWSNGKLVAQELLFGTSEIHYRDLTYTPDGRVSFFEDGLLGDVTYTYDDVGRLTGATYDLLGGGQDVYAYTYDTAGNRTAKTVNGVTSTYSVAIGNELASETTASVTTLWTYDTMGRPISKVVPGVGTTTYDYDAWGRLAEIVRPDTVVIEYYYDTWGDRIEKVVDGVSTLYYRDHYFFYEFDDQGTLLSTTGFAADGTTPLCWNGDGASKALQCIPITMTIWAPQS